MKAVIVDDERLAREELRGLLLEHPAIEVCGEAGTVAQAKEIIAENKPDLIFLDIQMPGKSGFDLLEALPPPHPFVIFTTAYNEYAVKAFEANALDYLMKPIHPSRLALALQKLADRLGEPGGEPVRSPRSGEALGPDDRVFVREGDRCWFVKVKTIRLLESEGNYTRIHFADQRPTLYRTLGSMEERLPDRLFMRANRSQLINLDHIESVEPWFSGSIKVKLAGGQEIEFSRRQAQDLRERLSL